VTLAPKFATAVALIAASAQSPKYRTASGSCGSAWNLPIASAAARACVS
jgi:hypothetical protein